MSEVCDTWPDIRGVLACHYSGLIPATTRDFRRAFGFAFTKKALGKVDMKTDSMDTESKALAARRSGNKMGIGTLEEVLETLGLRWIVENISGVERDEDVDALAQVPDEDFATLNFVNDFIVQYGLADTGKDHDA